MNGRIATPPSSRPVEVAQDPYDLRLSRIQSFSTKLEALESQFSELAEQLKTLREQREIDSLMNVILESITEEIVGFSVGATIDQVQRRIYSDLKKGKIPAVIRSGVAKTAASIVLSMVGVMQDIHFALQRQEEAEKIDEYRDLINSELFPAIPRLKSLLAELKGHVEDLRGAESEFIDTLERIKEIQEDIERNIGAAERKIE